jgi:hypothetical protein
MIAAWWCRRVGHRWAKIPPLEHICFEDWCWRCWEKRVVHLTGRYEHTCAEHRPTHDDDRLVVCRDGLAALALTPSELANAHVHASAYDSDDLAPRLLATVYALSADAPVR